MITCVLETKKRGSHKVQKDQTTPEIWIQISREKNKKKNPESDCCALRQESRFGGTYHFRGKTGYGLFDRRRYSTSIFRLLASSDWRCRTTCKNQSYYETIVLGYSQSHIV